MGEVAHVGSNMGTILTYVKLASAALELCMHDGKFGGDLLLNFIGQYLTLLFAHVHAVTLHVPCKV
jgi:hypothetical protein